MIAYTFFADGRPHYVREIPGEGGKDWGYVDARELARPLSPYWQARFRNDQQFCGRNAHFLEG